MIESNLLGWVEKTFLGIILACGFYLKYNGIKYFNFKKWGFRIKIKVWQLKGSLKIIL